MIQLWFVFKINLLRGWPICRHKLICLYKTYFIFNQHEISYNPNSHILSRLTKHSMMHLPIYKIFENPMGVIHVWTKTCTVEFLMLNEEMQMVMVWDVFHLNLSLLLGLTTMLQPFMDNMIYDPKHRKNFQNGTSRLLSPNMEDESIYTYIAFYIIFFFLLTDTCC